MFTPTMPARHRVAGRLPIGKPLPFQLFEIVVGIALGDIYIYRYLSENAS